MKKVKVLTKKFFDKYFKNMHPETAIRYLPIIKILKSLKLTDSKILEVGSGSLGITPYLKKPVDGIDIDFSGPQTKLITKIKAAGVVLPFGKNYYDVVLSVDVLEHIKATEREKAIYDMLRVAKKLAIIVVPVGKLSEKQDEELDTYFQKIFKTQNQFLSEHVENGLPTSDEILVTVDKSLRALGKVAKIQSYPILNLKIREILMKTWISKNKFLYYLYLKGYLLLLPILIRSNFGACYRRMFVIELAQ